MEQLNIEGKRSGEGFVCHRERLVSALSRAQAAKVEVIGITLGSKGFLSYLRALGGSNIVKITPNGSASGVQATDKGLKVVCGSNTSRLEDRAWVNDKMAAADYCEIRVSPNASVNPNLGGIELAEALSRVIPFAAGKKDERPVLQCIRFAQKEGKLTLTSTDAFRLADVSLDFEDGEGEALIPAEELRGLVSALKKAKRVRLGFTEKEDNEGGFSHRYLVIDTELIRYKWICHNGSYPDYEKLIPTEFIAEVNFDTREMLRAVASLGALSLDKGTTITLTVKDGMMTLSVKDDRGVAQIEAEVEGEAETAVDARYLAQALKALGGMAQMKVNATQAPILFTVDGYRLVVMPVVMPKTPKAVAEAEEVAKEAEAQAEGEGEAQTEEAEVQTEGEGEAQTEDTPKPSRKRKTKEPVAVEA